jgi:tRNA (guanine-N7-)-methyltransferase
LIDALPEACLSGVCILYPDPWPKRRHRERRFVSDEMLQRLARVMRRGAELRFASDIDDYVAWTLARILRSPDFIWPAQSESEWLTCWPGWTGTRYEAKAIREGRTPVYLTFIRR